MKERRKKMEKLQTKEEKKIPTTRIEKNDVRNIESKRRRTKIPIMINNSAGIKARARTPTLFAPKQSQGAEEKNKLKVKVFVIV